jgi:hypothetical protein
MGVRAVSEGGRSHRAEREPGGVEWVNVAGLVLDIVGATVLSFGLFVSKTDAVELSLSTIGVKPYLEHPQVKDRLRQSRNAMIGLAFLALGFALQIVAAWPT